MLSRIFPTQVDNNYRGNRLAIWFLVPIILLRGLIGFNSIFFARSVATSADGVPLDSFTPAAAGTVLALFALLGLFSLLLALLGLVVLVRYRAMIPFLYLFLLIQEVGNKAVLLAYPVTRSASSGAPAGSIVVFAILAMTLIGFVLSLTSSRNFLGVKSTGQNT
ncbi:MAG TPA: hypothetical protein VGJ08_01930 [Rhizomicrobium sp.]|jgi:hypothetical protein